MDRLYKGVHQFRKSHFPQEKDLFTRLSREQRPDVLFITCADSRIDPNLVTQSRPGDLFIVRNVGNIIPPYDAIKDKNSVAAAIEFAVLVLKVSDVIVCGHSNCGAMQAVFKTDEELAGCPHLRDWLRIADPVRQHMEQRCGTATGEQRGRITEQQNVLAQLRNLETYPFVRAAVLEKTLRLHGWYYDIATGMVSFYEPDTDRFQRIA